MPKNKNSGRRVIAEKHNCVVTSTSVFKPYGKIYFFYTDTQCHNTLWRPATQALPTTGYHLSRSRRRINRAPMKPMTSPITCTKVIFSLRNTTATKNSVISGTIDAPISASTELISVSAKASKMPKLELTNNERINIRTKIFISHGNLSLSRAVYTTMNSAPRAYLVKATPTGVRNSKHPLTNTNVEPQAIITAIKYGNQDFVFYEMPQARDLSLRLPCECYACATPTPSMRSTCPI